MTDDSLLFEGLKVLDVGAGLPGLLPGPCLPTAVLK